MEPGQSVTRQKAIEDARKTQASVLEECARTNKDPPLYVLTELIGKGSFGRVYKATRTGGAPNQLVAVKIINIEESDSASPRLADTFNEILKEVNTIKMLGQSGARNINHVLDTQLVGQSMWIVTEFCAGGSVATLMRPTEGLTEKWIIPILRETAEAIYWVHKQGIIHRDIKCANVLITDDGGVQLCDFGVAGVLDTKIDKRTTVTGTLHWMAPELFDPDPSYGTEIDIWAFGSMVYEVASGFPPNVTTAIDISTFGSQLKQHCPRLEGDKYSAQLKDLVAFCMVEDPKQRPSISDIQKHPYIADTAGRFPTASLSQLVKAYKLWESQGGIRNSLFFAGGARNLSDDHPSALRDEWRFDTNIFSNGPDDADLQAVYAAYGATVGFPAETLKPKPRRRMPPPQINPLRGPLEKIFDPNTISNYDENSRAFYGRENHNPPAEPVSDLPLRNSSQGANLRESLIDLDMSLDGSRLSRFADTGAPHLAIEPVTGHRRYSRPLSTDSQDLADPNRRTRDWTFPMMSPSMMSPSSADTEKPLPVPGDSGQSPRRKGLTISQDEPKRLSAVSLIDLDASEPGGFSDFSRPSTAHSNSASSVDSGSFDLERNTSGGAGTPPNPRQPSLYAPDGLSPDFAPGYQLGGTSQEGPAGAVPWNPRSLQTKPGEPVELPLAPAPPSTQVMHGLGSRDDVKDELLRLISSMADHLQYTDAAIKSHPVRRAACLSKGRLPSSS